jgi:hypothetical protein
MTGYFSVMEKGRIADHPLESRLSCGNALESRIKPIGNLGLSPANFCRMP